ncbi:MAG: hypothetical protein KR126chlam4_01512 [Candidatus Anoxychlamydiales bacterium]|uniref:Uncharacterized protein n=1 Tax=marine sediment metagenome TaxID=412755 RepID=A0A0F9JQT0_9ZZZZ|nr:hypothetical protein [Candidatus Anoxychlamydiales bacterium]HEU63832.1 hypothetical protein [Chlamydiota bacterium]
MINELMVLRAFFKALSKKRFVKAIANHRVIEYLSYCTSEFLKFYCLQHLLYNNEKETKLIKYYNRHAKDPIKISDENLAYSIWQAK